MSFLRKSGGKLEFASKVAGILATRGLTLIMGMVTSILVARALGPDGRGIFAVALASGNTALQFCSIGMPPAILHMASSRTQSSGRLLRMTWISGLILGCIGSLGIWLAFHFFPAISPGNGILPLLCMIHVPLCLILLLNQNLLLGAGEVTNYNISELITRGSALILMVAAILTTSVSPILMFSLTLAGSLAAIVFCQIKGRKLPNEISDSQEPSMKDLTSTVSSFGLKVYLAGLLGFLVLKSDIFLIKHYLGSSQCGHYSVAVTVASLIATLPTVVATLLFTRMNSIPDPLIKLKVGIKALVATFFTLTPITVILMIFGEPVVRIAFGEAFVPAARALVWLMPGTLLLGLETVAVQFLCSTTLPHSVTLWWAIGLIVNLAVNIHAIPKYGITGAAISSTIAYSIVAILVFGTIYFRIRELGILKPSSEKGSR
ncbi:MAG: hypothetical protein CVV64_15470 [Candidatus Wallbacteria bacterium HGW-Wallbacteria-1]|jgi:O-antigen/teichoic acid export membrane protein|uniref:Uncharacterized protein n=1 Tax=Candidatus Wallbacteria bacterium HGW-Wallbacteria-1 TaxID=2013854 RepID=A0A2N1PLJ1_9BACT|nr:MAG: hypothetical protein CVV64_15470 [Candidatus Wallbacteria bacterium HGW-Wallbacteria-1]